MKKYNPGVGKTCSFFSDFPPEEILRELASLLDSKHLKYQISNKSWNLKYVFEKKFQPFSLENDDGIQELKEQTTIQVDILEVDHNAVCVEFSRLTGSSSLFYE